MVVPPAMCKLITPARGVMPRASLVAVFLRLPDSRLSSRGMVPSSIALVPGAVRPYQIVVRSERDDAVLNTTAVTDAPSLDDDGGIGTQPHGSDFARG